MKLMARFLACTLAFAWAAPLAVAQISSVQLSGEVSDNSGAVIPNANVEVLNTGTGVNRSTSTNSMGVYVMPALDPGEYRVTVQASGFKKSITDHIVLSVSEKRTLNISLALGDTSQTVTVSAQNEQINTTTAEISSVINESAVKELPLNGRDPSSLVFLTTGVTNALNTNAGWLQASIPTETAASAGGGRQGSTYYMLDGVPNMDTYVLASAPFPNADATQEFRVISNNYSAQYGFAPSAVVSIQTKSGENSLHGVIFDFLRNQDFKAFLLMVYSMDGDSSRRCNGATLFG